LFSQANSQPVGCSRHHFRGEPHESLNRVGQLRCARIYGVLTVLLFLVAHLFHNGAAFRVLIGKPFEVTVEVGTNLLLCLGNKAEAPFVAEDATGGPDCECAGVPQRAQAARTGIEFCKTLLAPREVIEFLVRCPLHL